MMTAWPLIVRQFMPGMGFAQAAGEGASAQEAFNAARLAMVANRNYQVADMPGISPAVSPAPRTGRPAVGKSDADGEFMDAAARLKAKYSKSKSLVHRFSTDDDYRWPLDLHPGGSDRQRKAPNDQDTLKIFPFQHPGQYLAIVHIDGNSLGQRLMSLGASESAKKDFIGTYKKFSDAIEACTSAAAAKATTDVLLPNSEKFIVPARPIVLGGDDLTLIVRADLAIDFVRVFLAQFEIETTKTLKGMGLTGMTACAGIAYVKPTYPFHLGHEIAESLCGRAKTFSKKIAAIPSSLCFTRITNSLEDESTDDALTLGAYALKADLGLPAIGALLDLHTWSQKAGATSRFRALLGLAASDPDCVAADYARWRTLTAQREARDVESGAGSGATLDEFDCQVGTLIAAAKPTADSNFTLKTLGDLLTLVATNTNSTSTKKTDANSKEAAHG